MGFTSSSKFPLTPRHLSPFCMADFPAIRATGLDMLFQPHARVPCCVTPSLRRTAPVQEFQPVLHRLCSLPRLRSRLTLRRRSLLRNPRAFGGLDSHQPFRYSYQHSHFLPLHGSLRYRFSVIRTLPYPDCKQSAIASVPCLSPGHFRRSVSRPVSYYALFEWWLLLSQHPGCL